MKATKEELFDFVMNQNKVLMHIPINSMREWIRKTRISVSEFALMAGVHRSTVHKLMSGTISPSKTLMDHIKVLTAGKIRTEEDLIDLF